MKYLHDPRSRRVTPLWLISRALLPLLAELEAVFVALARELGDEQWNESAKKLRDAIEALKRPTEAVAALREQIRREEPQRAEQELERHKAEVEEVERFNRERMLALSARLKQLVFDRKGQARVRLPARRRA